MTEKIFFTPDSLGITSAYIPDIIAAMPPNSVFRAVINGTGIYENTSNKLNALAMSSGILTIEKANGYTRSIVTTNNSGGSDGRIYLGSIDTNKKIVNTWHEMDILAIQTDEKEIALNNANSISIELPYRIRTLLCVHVNGGSPVVIDRYNYVYNSTNASNNLLMHFAETYTATIRLRIVYV